MNPGKTNIIYFLGIGGIGMSALARYFLNEGKEIHGYDLTATSLTDQLEDEGMYIHFKEDISKIPKDTDLVIYTPAIPVENTEYNYLRLSGIPMFKRAEVIGDLTKNHFTIAVAGTHGKTSICAFTAHILKSAGLGISAFVGGIMKNYNSNLIVADSANYLLIEADEFDHSFLQIHPDIALISSIDADHLDIYSSYENVISNFREFAGKTSDGGKLIYNVKLDKLHDLNSKKTSYGLNPDAEIHARNLRIENGQIIFDVISEKSEIKDVRMMIPGAHYVENAVAATAIALQLGVDTESIKSGLESFTGVERRFDIRLRGQQVYIDDYAHHPEEIKATVSAVKVLFPDRKITGIFQPHLFSRTRDFAEEFAISLEPLDEVLLLEIYPAREKPIPGITSAIILEKIKNDSKRLIAKADLLEYLATTDTGVVITMGAGDIGLMVEDIEKILTAK